MSSTIILCPISVGELLDKISILRIKLSKISGERKKSVKKELGALEKIYSELKHPEGSEKLQQQLNEINKSMWEVNDMKRKKAKANEIDKEFIYWAVKEDEENDRRFEIKKQINMLYKSSLIEEKGYDKYNELS
jgi:hypothetical protein